MKKLAAIFLAMLMMTCCVLASGETFTGEDNGIGAITVTLTVEDGKYFVNPYGVKIEVNGKKADMLTNKGVQSGEIILGVRHEQFVLSDESNPAAIPCKIVVNEMMGSELHLHVLEDNGDRLIVRIPTVSLTDEQRASLVYGSTIYVTFEGKVMHFFDPETQLNLLV